MATLQVPFVLRGRGGVVLADVRANDDPEAWGCPLLDPALPVDAARGYPVCTASIEYPMLGYAAAMGWVQFVPSSDSDSNAYEIDPMAIYRDVNTPYAWFGAPPELFDAPFRARRFTMAWRARSYLCVSPDGVMSRQAHALAAFSWGFDIDDALSITIVGPTPLDVSAWDEHIPTLRAQFPGWIFGRNM